MTRFRKDVGDWGEEMACGFLLRQGFEVVERNFHTTVGEIDIVAQKGGDFYFIEVKTRTDADLANDLSITESKKRRLSKAVKTYCYRKNIGEVGIIFAGLIVTVLRMEKKVLFRFAVMNTV